MPRVVPALSIGLLLLLAEGACTSTTPPAPAPGARPERSDSPTFAGYSPAQFSEALLVETNRMRLAHACAVLRRRAPIDAAADDQASISSLRLTAVHTSPLPGQATPRDRVRRRGVEAAVCAENVASIPLGTGEDNLTAADIAARLVAAWMDSPGHRANLLSREITDFGGSVRIVRGPAHVWYAFGVQVFVRPDK